MNTNRKTELLLVVFITALIASNLLGVKITSIFGVAVSAGIIMFPLTFLITDMVEEVHGKKRTRQFVKYGALALIIVFFFAWIAVKLRPHSYYVYNSAYELIFSGSLRMIIASLVAFLIGQYHDIWAFNFWKRKTQGKKLWFRNNASTMVSQLIDSTVFSFIAFYKFAPSYDAWFIVKLIIPFWLIKCLIAAIDTPFCYWGVKWLRKDKVDTNKTLCE